MPEVDINLTAVLAAAAVNMVIGALWYSRQLFGRQWMKLTGRKLEEMGGGGTSYAVAGVGALVQSYILAHFVAYAAADSFAEGLITGFWLWLGFVAIVYAVHMMFEGRPFRLWQINTGYFLVVLLINGGVLAIWS